MLYVQKQSGCKEVKPGYFKATLKQQLTVRVLYLCSFELQVRPVLSFSSKSLSVYFLTFLPGIKSFILSLLFSLFHLHWTELAFLLACKPMIKFSFTGETFFHTWLVGQSRGRSRYSRCIYKGKVWEKHELEYNMDPFTVIVSWFSFGKVHFLAY